MESSSQFEKRKSDHIRIALDSKTQAEGQNGLDQVVLIHEALPEINYSEVDISTSFFSHKLSSPLFISSMTAGHTQGHEINAALARLSSRRRILMGVGSQRREITDPQATQEWKELRQQVPGAMLLANIGIAQLIKTPVEKILELVDSLQAVGLFVHLNALQECLQPEGTPEFKGALKAIEKMAQKSTVPVIIKEVGCGFSRASLQRLEGSGIYAVDISGYGGTHWGRIEGYRSEPGQLLYEMAQTFANWGIPTAQSMLNAIGASVSYQVWASGGVRNGLEAAKLCAMGAAQVGLAQPFLRVVSEALGQKNTSADVVDRALDQYLSLLESEMKLALFCSGVANLQELKQKKIWELR